jgi:hypothetical protein
MGRERFKCRVQNAECRILPAVNFSPGVGYSSGPALRLAVLMEEMEIAANSFALAFRAVRVKQGENCFVVQGRRFAKWAGVFFDLRRGWVKQVAT